MQIITIHFITILVLALAVNGTRIYDEHNVHYFHVPKTSTLTISSDVYKHGDRALKWVWRPGDVMMLDLFHRPVQKNELDRGGTKIWLYLRKKIPGQMILTFHTLIFWTTRAQPECEFRISLEFTGWRAVWVSFQECKLRHRILPLYEMRLQAPIWHAGVIYFDILRIGSIKRQSRDNIVPPIRTAKRSISFWQQTYHWSLVEPRREIFNELELNDEQLRHLKDIRLIRTRLKDWYRVKGKSSYDLTGHYRKRWARLRSEMKKAREYLRMINITKTKYGFIQGPPLFARNSEYGKDSISTSGMKYGYLLRTVLLPLSFEYYFASRKEEIRRILEIELPKLNDPKQQRQTLQKVVGFDREFMNIFYEKYKLGFRPLTRQKLRIALREINHKRFLRIHGLLEYIIDQGWAVGSALGSLDHEMNRSSKGFVTSIFILRKPLYHTGLLPQLIDILKWYLEFGELYQKRFEFPGTTADRLKTLFSYRLMCILVLPEATLDQALDKLRDMKALKAWYENSLRINPALGGTIKPDYTGYHHKSFYPSDYVLPGLLTASHVVYLLRGTEYELTQRSKDNLRKAIHFMRLLPAQYVFPNSVTNSSPTVSKPELICLIPAFAYVASWDDTSRDSRTTHTRDQRASSRYKENLRVFLRLFNESNRAVRAYLSRGKECSSKATYMFTLGSLTLLYEVKQRAMELGIDAEHSPQGNWAKNFAALSIHRRESWVVSVKGFNNFIWGHESSHRGNEYGRYQSYGQLLIANTDDGLKAHDIDRGWDWTRLPGTTSLRVPVGQLSDRLTRFYNRKSLCGGMTFQGTSRFRNGVFAMDFERPLYSDKAAKFWFKKSVFFFDELVVCIGSDIRARRFTFRPIEVETTLFQNIGHSGDKSHSVRLNGFRVPLGRTERARRFVWGRKSAAMLMDVNQNGYYIPHAGKQNLDVRLMNQTSYNSQKTSGVEARGYYYATAVLRHGGNPYGLNYEYAILVNTSFEKLYKMACGQERIRGSPKYEILRQDSHAHVVKFNNSPRFGLATYGYAIFTPGTVLPGPLGMVGDACVLMVEDGGRKSTRLIIGVSYPQLNFNSTKKMRTSHEAKEEELYYMRSEEKRIWVLLRSTVKQEGFKVYVDGNAVDRQDAEGYVRVIPIPGGANAGSLVYFRNLYNGFTSEVHLRKIVGPNVEI